MEESKLKKDIDNMFVTITKTIENLTQLQTKMERLNYFIIAEFLESSRENFSR